MNIKQVLANSVFSAKNESNHEYFTNESIFQEIRDDYLGILIEYTSVYTSYIY